MAEENLKQELQDLRDDNDVLKGTIAALLNENLKHQIREALIAEGANGTLLVPHILEQTRIIQNDDAHSTDARFEVFNRETKIGRVNSKGQPMTIIELVQEMKTQEAFIDMFSDNENVHKVKPKIINAEDVTRDRTKPEINLDDIATGKVKVNFQPDKNAQAPADAIPVSNIREIGQNLEDIAEGKTKVDMNN